MEFLDFDQRQTYVHFTSENVSSAVIKKGSVGLEKRSVDLFDLYLHTYVSFTQPIFFHENRA